MAAAENSLLDISLLHISSEHDIACLKAVVRLMHLLTGALGHFNSLSKQPEMHKLSIAEA